MLGHPDTHTHPMGVSDVHLCSFQTADEEFWQMRCSLSSFRCSCASSGWRLCCSGNSGGQLLCKHAWKSFNGLVMPEERTFKFLTTEIQTYSFCPEREIGAFVQHNMHEYTHPYSPCFSLTCRPSSSALCSLPVCICFQPFGQFALKHDFVWGLSLVVYRVYG